MRIKTAFTTAAVAGALVLTGCGGDGDTAATGGGAATSSPTAAEAAEAFNEADVSFAQNMIVHHRQAVEMAELAAEQAESPEVRQLGEDIAAAQGPEIEAMTAWLEAWGEDVPEDMTGAEGMDMGGTPMSDMPGMMGDEEMNELMAASGADFDRMFLTMMIEHHEGAIEMAQTEQAEGENPDAVALAEKVEADQTAEIATMRDLLGS